MKKLNVDYIDLYILHQPYGDVIGAYKALEEAQTEGKIKSIGVSNQDAKFLKDFLPKVNVMPSVNQIECNPFCQRKDERDIMSKNNIALQSWYPIGHGNKELLNNNDIVEIGTKYNKSSVQVILKWHIQNGFIAIPKSTSKEHIVDNFNIFDFELSQEDMQKIEKLDTGKPSFIHDEEFGKQLLSWVVPE